MSRITPSTTMSQELYDKLYNDQMVLTHGYVHGHIHKHKDHTHIHGHIHNHDHNQENQENEKDEGVQEQQLTKAPVLTSSLIDSCKQLEDELNICNEIFCDELDDCYFHSCDDNLIENDDCKNCDYNELSCCDDELDQSLLPLAYEEVCNDPSCLDSNSCCQDSINHQDNLCDLQYQKKPIFENLIGNVHKNFDLESSSIKKRKLNDNDNIKLHFPHPCHPDTSLNTNDHNLHQSCFHTRIPTNTSEKMMSDFDFYIQFNNFKKIMSNKDENLLNFSEKPLVVPDLLSQPEKPNLSTFACRWDNCFKKVTDDTLMNHLINDHIDQDYNSPNANQSFQCEWNDCNYMNEDLNTLITHLNCHRGKHDINNSLYKKESPILTPNSISKSSLSSPDNKIIKNEFDNDRESSPFTITSMKISPKKSSCRSNCSHKIDDKFTCKWQIGTNSDGSPMSCDKTHNDSGDLQNHLMNDHIGSGKSIYHCNWIDCERNHGKHFTQRQKLLRHIHIHTNYKPCKCSVCGSSFAVDSMLKQHMRIHSGEKPFKCNICGKNFATSSSLSIHNRTHTGEKPLICKWPNCGKRFSESSNLTKHMKIHTKLFKCDHCGEEFDKKIAFTKHSKLHQID